MQKQGAIIIMNEVVFPLSGTSKTRVNLLCVNAIAWSIHRPFYGRSNQHNISSNLTNSAQTMRQIVQNRGESICRYEFDLCLKLGVNLVADIAGGKEAEDVCDQGVEENIWT
jgi:hypothetical protein